MPSQLWGADPNIFLPGDAVPTAISAQVNALVTTGVEAFEIVRPDNAKGIWFESESATWRIRAGRHIPRAFADGDVAVATDRITITDHGYETGDGPLQLYQANQFHRTVTGETLTFDQAAGNDTLTRSDGDWTVDGFAVAQVITVVGSTLNDGTYTIAAISGGGNEVLEFAGDVFTDEVGVVAASQPSIAGVEVYEGALPAGLATFTNYWVAVIDDDTIVLCTSPGAANRIAQTGASSATVGDPIQVDITAAAGGGGHELGNVLEMITSPLDGDTAIGMGLTPGVGRPLRGAFSTARVTTVRATVAGMLLYWIL